MNADPGAMGFLFLIPMIIGGMVALLATAFWIWMIVDCATNEPGAGNDKIIWILIIVLAHLLGAVIYYFARRPTRIQQYGK